MRVVDDFNLNSVNRKNMLAGDKVSNQFIKSFEDPLLTKYMLNIVNCFTNDNNLFDSSFMN